MADVDGGDQMPDVGRIERAPEYPDVQGLFGGLRTRPASLRATLLPIPAAVATGPVLTPLLQ